MAETDMLLRWGFSRLRVRTVVRREPATAQSRRTGGNYAQRYCVKNDTIGFFGPVAWGRIEAGEESLDFLPGPSLIKKRQAYFENWAVDRIAASLFAQRRHCLVDSPASSS